MNTTNEKTATNADVQHVFMHLGRPPYRFTGFEQRTYQACPGAPVQVGGSCDHCGTGIIDTFTFVSSDGKTFKVGSSCVKKSGDKGLYSQIQRQVNKVNTEKRHIREKTIIDTARKALENKLVRATLATRPHPKAWGVTQGKTLLDYVEWMMTNSGNAGRVRAARFIEGVIKFPSDL